MATTAKGKTEEQRAELRGPRIIVAIALGLGGAISTPAQTPATRDLTQFSLEDLMNVQVTSVSKKEQKLAKTGAAVFVITKEDIRRSGATNIPDLLRTVPGVNVARVDHSNWAISIRGFSGVYSNKVLVLIDGRSIATGGGSKVQAEALVQYGGTAGAKGDCRVFARYSNLGKSDPANIAPAADSRHLHQGGFRADWNLSAQDLLTVQGEIHFADGGETLTGIIPQTPTITGTFATPLADDGEHVLGRWTHAFSNGADTSLQAYFDKSHEVSNGIDDWVSIGNIDFQHHLSLGSRNDVVWGLGLRRAANRFAGNNLITLNPLERTDTLYGAFVQDEITLTRTLSLTLGSKFEHNAYTGFENELSAQLVWAPTSRHTLWASAAKAIRQPSNIDSGLQAIGSIVPLPQGAFGLVTVFGNPNTKVEQLRDLETGYRSQINPRLSLDVSGFLSFYKHLETTEPQTPLFTLTPGPPHLVLPFIYDYKAHARNYGAEAFANWNVTDRWRLSPGLTMLNMSVSRDPTSQDATIEQQPGYSPKRSYQVRSFVKLGRNFEWDQTIGYTGRLATGNIPAYVRLDTRFGWRIGESWELSISGQNLLTPRHAEFPDASNINHMLDQRSVFGKITWHF